MTTRKIQVLLIDDKPTGWFEKKDNVRDVTLKSLPSELFDIHWIRTPGEARRFLDTYSALSIAKPEQLRSLGLPPDLIIFDYSLTDHGDRTVAPKQGAKSLISVRLAEHAERMLGKKFPEFKEDNFGYVKGQDRFGCYIGVSFLASFQGHPCGAVPTTAHGARTYDGGDDVAFFEWLHERSLGNGFHDKTQIGSTPENTIPVGLKRLRDGIEESLRSGFSHYMPKRSNDYDDEIILKTHYGDRKYSFDALFFDVAFSDREKEVSKFLEKIRAAQFERLGGFGTYSSARETAQEYLDILDMPDGLEEDALEAKWIITSHKSSNDSDVHKKQRFDEACETLNVDADVARRGESSFEFPSPHKNPIYKQRSPEFARWVIPMLVVLVLAHRLKHIPDADVRDLASEVKRAINPLPKNPFSNRVSKWLTDFFRNEGLNKGALEAFLKADANGNGFFRAGETQILSNLARAEQVDFNHPACPAWLID